MSFDLYFKPRKAELDLAAVRKHFAGRLHYTAQDDQAFYRNEATGVYFSFEIAAPEDEYPLAFNINMCRPSYFILEAEPEVRALVEAFDFTIQDTQMDGMGEGEYSCEGLIRSWNASNAFGYSAFLAHENTDAPLTLPTAKLMQVWQWNFAVARRQAEMGDDVFVPKIMFLKDGGDVLTAVVWTDAIPTAFPPVDRVLVYRDSLAPRRFFSRKPDFCLLGYDGVAALLKGFDRGRMPGAIVPGFKTPPAEIAAFVKGLSAIEGKPEMISADQVLDREIVERCQSGKGWGVVQSDGPDGTIIARPKRDDEDGP